MYLRWVVATVKIRILHCMVSPLQYLTKYLLLEQPQDPFTCIIERVSMIKASLAESGSLPTEMSSKRPSEASSQEYMEKHNIGQVFEVGRANGVSKVPLH